MRIDRLDANPKSMFEILELENLRQKADHVGIKVDLASRSPFLTRLVGVKKKILAGIYDPSISRVSCKL